MGRREIAYMLHEAMKLGTADPAVLPRDCPLHNVPGVRTSKPYVPSQVDDLSTEVGGTGHESVISHARVGF